jgi:hypothetical protein
MQQNSVGVPGTVQAVKLKCTADVQREDWVILFSASGGVFAVVQRTGTTELSFAAD